MQAQKWQRMLIFASEQESLHSSRWQIPGRVAWEVEKAKAKPRPECRKVSRSQVRLYRVGFDCSESNGSSPTVLVNPSIAAQWFYNFLSPDSGVLAD